jgi:hypothetical protein
MMKKPVWRKIPDSIVQHVWKKAADDDCGEGPKTVVVPPGWYEENGTPICFCGEDLVYSHTEILTPNDQAQLRSKVGVPQLCTLEKKMKKHIDFSFQIGYNIFVFNE